MSITFSVKDRLAGKWAQEGKRAKYTWLPVTKKGKLVKLPVTNMQEQLELRQVEVFRLSVLALALDRKVATLKGWLKAGIFPKAVIVIDGSTIPYYSTAQVVSVHRLWREKYKARSRIREADVFQEMLADFRIILQKKFIDRYVVSEQGIIDTGADFRPDTQENI